MQTADLQLYGAICGNIGSALVGGPGVVPGCNFGREYALFEPGCRHVGKDIMGTNKANPTALILSATMMLRHLGLDVQANAIAEATYGLVAEGKVRTADLGGEWLARRAEYRLTDRKPLYFRRHQGHHRAIAVSVKERSRRSGNRDQSKNTSMSDACLCVVRRGCGYGSSASRVKGALSGAAIGFNGHFSAG